jgi:transcriptional regulator GlxA family with amidase domain
VIAFGDEVLAALRRLVALADPRLVHEATVIAAAVHEFVMLLFTSLRRDLVASQSPVERAIDAILANPTHPWSLKEVAERHRCSREHLTRAFTRRLGTAPGAWLAEARVRRAIQLLRETALPVAAVAEQSGFSSTHTLARQVRAATGSSPRLLRRTS